MVSKQYVLHASIIGAVDYYKVIKVKVIIGP